MILTFVNKTTKTSKHVSNMHKKWSAMSLYSDIYVYVTDIVYATYYLNNNRDRTSIHQLQRECDKYLEYVKDLCNKDVELKDCLAKIINADYRQSLYNKYYQIYDHESKLMMELLFYDVCEEIYVQKLDICDVENYKHDPTHYLFDDGYYYAFYEKLEKDGVSDIYKMYQEQKENLNTAFIYDSDTNEYESDEWD